MREGAPGGTPTVNRRTAIIAIAGAAVTCAGSLVTLSVGRPREVEPLAPPCSPATTESEAFEKSQAKSPEAAASELLALLDISQVTHEGLDHGPKPVEYQKYIVLHDTEGDGAPEDIISYWAGNGNLVAAQYVVGKDGHIAQCVGIDRIAHHAGFGDAGHNELYGVEDESRDDKRGTTSIGSACPDYGMNSYSVGIEMVHVGGEGDYPTEQLNALDSLIAYIDAYFAEEGQSEPSAIIDHKAWRTGNSDTSPEFATYLANYQDHRTHA